MEDFTHQSRLNTLWDYRLAAKAYSRRRKSLSQKGRELPHLLQAIARVPHFRYSRNQPKTEPLKCQHCIDFMVG